MLKEILQAFKKINYGMKVIKEHWMYNITTRIYVTNAPNHDNTSWHYKIMENIFRTEMV